MNKRFISLLLCLTLFCGGMALAENVIQDEAPNALQPGTEVTVGTITPTTGHFFSNMWGYNTSDVDVRFLLHGYGTLVETRDQLLTIDDSVISDVRTEATASGGKRYVFTLRPGRTYNDGTTITAKDYVFSVLLHSAPQVKALGANSTIYAHLAGYADFARNSNVPFSGVRLISPASFSLEISKEALLYFYELTYVDVLPAPLHVIAPGCDVADDGSGAYLTGDFTETLLRETLLDPATGYVFRPKVTCGPYQLESYDSATKEAVFTANPAYRGNYEGQIPLVERIRLVPVTNDNMIEKLESGQVDLLNKVGSAANIDALLVGSRAGKYQNSNYMRSGFTFLAFACESGPTASQKVRQALAYLTDRNAITAAFASDYGLEVYGCYGLGQWMTMYRDDAIDALEQVSTLPEYALDIGKASQLLDEDGWNLDEEGGAYVADNGSVRHKKIDGKLVPLELRWAKSEGNVAADAAEKLLLDTFRQAGIQLTVTAMPYEDVLRQYYRQENRDYQLFYLATNFTHVFDPYLLYHTGDDYQGTTNTSGLRDDELMNLALDLRQTKPGDNQTYVRKWVTFQRRWAEVLPAVPLFSNTYFDFYSNSLQSYGISSFSSWASAMLYAYVQE